MKLYYLLLLYLFLFTACANFRTAINNDQREYLSEENIVKLNGNYKRYAKLDTMRTDIFWNVFTRGYNTKVGAIDYIQLEFVRAHKMKVSLYSDSIVLKSKTIGYKIKDGYCVFKRRHFVLPAIYFNIFRNTKFRIGMLKNNNLVGDFNEVFFGTIFFVIPSYASEKHYNKEFERLSLN